MSKSASNTYPIKFGKIAKKCCRIKITEELHSCAVGTLAFPSNSKYVQTFKLPSNPICEIQNKSDGFEVLKKIQNEQNNDQKLRQKSPVISSPAAILHKLGIRPTTMPDFVTDSTSWIFQKLRQIRTYPTKSWRTSSNRNHDFSLLRTAILADLSPFYVCETFCLVNFRLFWFSTFSRFLSRQFPRVESRLFVYIYISGSISLVVSVIGTRSKIIRHNFTINGKSKNRKEFKIWFKKL